MRHTLPVRLLLAAAATLLLALVLLALLYATELGFQVWERLSNAPLLFGAAYALALMLLAGAAAWLIWRVIFGWGRPRRASEEETLDEAGLMARVESASEAGVPVEIARRELAELQARRETGEVHVVLFGRVSTGKSSLVRALLPEAQVLTGPRSGTTRAPTRYAWTSPAGDRLVITDLPGLNEPDGSLDEAVRDEALRAHVVIYLVDGDLTRDQYTELQSLAALDKPLILALNKADLYAEAELERIRERLAERVSRAHAVDVVAVSAGARREAVRVNPDGSEQIVLREQPPRVEALVGTLQRRIDEGLDGLDRLRDAAVFVLARRKLDAAVAGHRREQAALLVSEHTRKAVIGAMAAISPGADVVIQGYLGASLVRALCRLYQVPVREIDVERLLEKVAWRGGKLVPLSLAVAGNALKAFPGIGTLGGGLAHAVAYGLLFDSLGKAVARTLEARGELPAGVTIRTFEETLGEDLESRARSLARLALEKRAGAADTDP